MTVGAFQVGPFQANAYQQQAGVTVPDVVGQLEADGTTTLEGAGFVVVVEYERSSTVERGKVTRQVPVGGLLASAGSIVTIWISLGAASGAGKHKRRRFFVEIDGKEFEVSGPEQAKELLTQAKALIQTQIEAEAERAVIQVKGGVSVPKPKITTKDPELKAVVREARNEILDLYDQMIRDLEIRILMARAEEEDEEETLIRFLM